MLNEVRSKHIRGLIIAKWQKSGTSMEEVLKFEVAKREDMKAGMEAQIGRVNDELEFVSGLDASELEKEI